MAAAVNGIGIVCLMTHVCLASAILTAKVSLDPISIPWHAYPSSTPRHPNHQYDNHATEDRNLKKLSPKNSQAERSTELSSASLLSAHKQRGPQRFPTEIHGDVWLAKAPNLTTTLPPTTTRRTTLSGQRRIRGYPRYGPQYQKVQMLDGYLTEEPGADKFPYGKPESNTVYRHHGQLNHQDLTAAIEILDRFLSRTLNSDGYNSELHPPPNPVLALVLSRYGHYVPGTRNPRVYAYMAVNNIHNNLPFGKYKYECDEEPIYATR